MLQRIAAHNTFVTRIKHNTKHKSVAENSLPDDNDQDILKDEIIMLTGEKAVDTGMDKIKLRLVNVYKEAENKGIEIVSTNLDGRACTIADLYKKR